MDQEYLSQPNKGSYMPYPVSTLSPKIVPNDLTNFKSRGISKIERDLEQKLIEMREQYLRTIDQFNWNKLIYEAEINFEPVIGQQYHLYEIRGSYNLSMIPPEEWMYPHLGTFRLNADQQWESVTLNPNLDREKLFSNNQSL